MLINFACVIIIFLKVYFSCFFFNFLLLSIFNFVLCVYELCMSCINRDTRTSYCLVQYRQKKCTIKLKYPKIDKKYIIFVIVFYKKIEVCFLFLIFSVWFSLENVIKIIFWSHNKRLFLEHYFPSFQLVFVLDWFMFWFKIINKCSFLNVLN